MNKYLILIIICIALFINSCSSVVTSIRNVETNNVGKVWARAHSYTAKFCNYNFNRINNYIIASNHIHKDDQLVFIKEQNKVVILLSYEVSINDYIEIEKDILKHQIDLIKQYISE